MFHPKEKKRKLEDEAEKINKERGRRNRWLSGIMERYLTYDQKVVGLAPGQVAIRWLLLE